MPKQRLPFPERAIQETVQAFPKVDQNLFFPSHNAFTFYMASVAERLTPWGKNVAKRDRELRQFWPSENMLASAIATVCQRNAAFNWVIEGSPRLKEAIEFVLHNAISGETRGWVPFTLSVSQDLYSQDNGAFIEIIRDGDGPTAPVIGIAHLDAGACVRTGDPYVPVLYTDRENKVHKMDWYKIITLSDFPSSIQTMNGVGFSAVTRVLRGAEMMSDLAQYKHEKISGRFARAIHVIGGVSRAEIKDIQKEENEVADSAGQTHFIMPMLITSLDPTASVSHVEIPLASLPDGFDFDDELKWYITQLALGFGTDYQDFAPLPGGNLGTSTQSEVLHRKSRGKGPALFMSTIQNAFKWFGVLPRGVNFKYAEQDLDFEIDQANIREIRARERAIRIRSGEITPEIARQLAIESNDLERYHLSLLGETEPEDLPAGDIGLDEDMVGDDTMPDSERIVEKNLFSRLFRK